MMYEPYFKNYFHHQLDFRGHTGLLGIGKFLPIMKVKWEHVTNAKSDCHGRIPFSYTDRHITLFHTFEIAFRIENSHQ